MDSFAFRSVRPADHPALADLWRRSAATMGIDATRLPPLSELERRLRDDFGAGWEITLAERGGRLAGFLAIEPAKAMLGQLFLHPDFIGHGLGGVLFDRARARMSRGFDLYTPATNARAIAFYIRRGMVETRRARHPEFGHEIIWLRWSP